MALREINLVPMDMLAQHQLKRHVFFWAVCISLCLALVLVSYGYEIRAGVARKYPDGNITEMNRRLAMKIEDIKRLQGEYDQIKNHQDFLVTATANMPFTQILFRLAGAMNGSTWLSSLDMDRGREKQGDIILRLKGFSIRSDTLGDFLTDLSSDPLFKQVSLKYAQEARMDSPEGTKAKGMDITHFEIECRVSRSG